MYRFRNIDNLLGKYQELEKQEIYFADKSELNDPMEGFMDVFWKGDKIVWKNFIVNYTYSLENLFKIYSIIGESKRLDETDILLNYQINRKQNWTKNNENLTAILNDLFSVTFISDFPDKLAKREKPIRKNELVHYLQFIHNYALNSINKIHTRNGFGIPFIHIENPEIEKIIEKVGSLPELTNEMESENKNCATEELMTQLNITSQSIRLQSKKELDSNKLPVNQLLLLVDFPQLYLTKLVEELYPPWYSASFLSECNNSAVWGHYGDNHKGVCLKFRTTNFNNELTLKLITEYGLSEKPLVDYRPHIFRKIEYQNNYPEIDYFRSIGRMTRTELEYYWYKDEKGNISDCGKHLYDVDDSIWINELWSKYHKSITKKLNEWHYENEYRLIIEGDFVDYSDKNNRKLAYDFFDLETIIFGMNTSNDDKIGIMKIIDKKCKEYKRGKFEYQQAYYSAEKKQIDFVKIK